MVEKQTQLKQETRFAHAKVALSRAMPANPNQNSSWHSCRLTVGDNGRLRWCIGKEQKWRTKLKKLALIPVFLLIAVAISLAVTQLVRNFRRESRDGRGSVATRHDFLGENKMAAYAPTWENLGEVERDIYREIQTSFVVETRPENRKRLEGDGARVEARRRPTRAAPNASSPKNFWKLKHTPAEIRRTQAENMRKFMDAAADPCDDFYQYACGNWHVHNPIPPDRASFDTFEMLRENLDAVLRDLLEDDGKPPEDHRGSYEDDEGEEGDSHRSFLSGDEEEDYSFARKNEDLVPEENFRENTLFVEELGAPFGDEGGVRAEGGNFGGLWDEEGLGLFGGKARRNVSEAGKFEEDAVLKARMLYRSCMDVDEIKLRGIEPLLKLLRTLGGWPILQGAWNETEFEFERLLGRLRLYNNDIIVSEWVGPDIRNSEEYVIQIDQSSLGLPSRDYFLEKQNARFVDAYKTFIKTTAVLLGGDYATVEADVEELVAFETELSAITVSAEHRKNVSDIYVRLKLRELCRIIPQIDWIKYVAVVLKRGPDLDLPIVTFSLNYLHRLVGLLSATRRRTVANYLLWRFVRHRINNLDDRFQDAKQRFYRILFGRERAPSRWQSCVSQVNSNLGMALGNLFVTKYFDETSKNDTLEMTRLLRHTFKNLLMDSPWLDLDTKISAALKINYMRLKIGYPDYILSRGLLNSRYRDVHIHPKTYFENTLSILRHLTNLEHSKLKVAVDKNYWNSPPAVVNAYYSRNKNQIMFPAGILQPPFYHRDFPKCLNFGGIGVVIGHEMTHGFDDKGRLFDKDGNLKVWWKRESIEEFHQRAKCLVAQYNSYFVPEAQMLMDGANTQGENIADNGGIKQAFRAYRALLGRLSGRRERLPGLDLSGLQLFFLNFAQIWCGSTRPEAARNKLRTAVHSPGRFRVIGTLSNSDEFAEVFACPVGARMNPKDKCKIW